MSTRCAWAAGPDELLRRYHDEEWGLPVHADRRHFEFLLLEGAQAGLSWTSILHRRANYARAFARFDPAKVARFTPTRIQALLRDPGIIRNRQKVESAVRNARAFLQIQREFGSFDAYVQTYRDGSERRRAPRVLRDVPASSPESVDLSRDLRRRGFGFVGPTIIYAYMQAVGVVNDHVSDCFRRRELMAGRRGGLSGGSMEPNPRRPSRPPRRPAPRR